MCRLLVRRLSAGLVVMVAAPGILDQPVAVGGGSVEMAVVPVLQAVGVVVTLEWVASARVVAVVVAVNLVLAVPVPVAVVGVEVEVGDSATPEQDSTALAAVVVARRSAASVVELVVEPKVGEAVLAIVSRVRMPRCLLVAAAVVVLLVWVVAAYFRAVVVVPASAPMAVWEESVVVAGVRVALTAVSADALVAVVVRVKD
jgi:hypothetical protein